MKSLGRVSLLLALSLGSATAFADTISLKNGRHIEGRIVSRSSTTIRVEVPGGEMDLPRSQVATIEEKLTVEDDFAQRYQRLDQDDAEGLEALAGWAKQHDLESQARSLVEHARGVRLEKRFALAKTADDFAALAAWTREQGYSIEVRRLAASKALELSPRNADARHELALARADERAQQAAEAAARRRELEERERAIAERERTLSLREKALHDRGAATTPAPRDAGSTPSTDSTPPATPTDTSTPPEEPPEQGYIVVHRGHRQHDDDWQQQPQPQPAPQPRAQGGFSQDFIKGGPSAPSTSPNPIPGVPNLPR